MVMNSAGKSVPRDVPVGAIVSVKPVKAGISKDGCAPMMPITAAIIIKYKRKELR